MVTALPWVILFAPLVSALFIVFFALNRPKVASTVAIAGILAAAAASFILFGWHVRLPHFEPSEIHTRWIQAGALEIGFGFLIDRLSLLMLLVVTGVGGCIFIYSTEYMKDDPSYARFFACLSFFAFSMIGIVLADNFIMLFVFWELVAVSSYLLIGFWFEKPSAADAGNKAFIVNRLADFGLVLGIFYVWVLSGSGGADRTFSFSKLSIVIPELFQSGLISPAALTIAALLVFCGVVGKSAQFPLYIWLPDAMEGPTPVSALIHAATMVAAGVFLFSRTFFLAAGLPGALETVAWIGAVTLTLAALLAVVQNDIKKILAYSTVSQLGYMVMALGLGSSAVAMYHLTTHAFFKALLFLGAGAMIHGLHTQDIWEMGGLLKKMPVTAITFIVGTLALCGIWPLSGFFSKDEILTLAFEKNRALFVIGTAGAGLTAFYMSRALWVAVLGRSREAHHGHGHSHREPHEAPAMNGPLILLAVLSILAGFFGIPAFVTGHHEHMPLNLTVALISTGVALGGILIGTFIFARLKMNEDPLKKIFGGAYQFVVKKYYLDELFLWLAGLFQTLLAKLLFWFDANVVMRTGVGGSARLTASAGDFLRRAQTGKVQHYAMVFCLGVLALSFWILTHRS